MTNTGCFYRVHYDDHNTNEFYSGGIISLCDSCVEVYEDMKTSNNTDVSLEYWEDITECDNEKCNVCGSKIKS